jgi:hypothetical protein
MDSQERSHQAFLNFWRRWQGIDADTPIEKTQLFHCARRSWDECSNVYVEHINAMFECHNAYTKQINTNFEELRQHDFLDID